jgi:TetR/AcrR family transcriptional regulator
MKQKSNSRRNGNDRRDEMIAMARQIVLKRGYSYLTAGTICAEMHVARPLFYHYFQGTEQIAQEIIRQQVTHFESFVRQWVIQTSSTSMAMCVRRSASVIEQAGEYGFIFVGQDSASGNEELIAQYEVAVMKRDGRTIAQTIATDARGCSGPGARNQAQKQQVRSIQTSRDEENLVMTTMWGILSHELLAKEMLSRGQIEHLIAPIVQVIAARA